MSLLVVVDTRDTRYISSGDRSNQYLIPVVIDTRIATLVVLGTETAHTVCIVRLLSLSLSGLTYLFNSSVVANYTGLCVPLYPVHTAKGWFAALPLRAKDVCETERVLFLLGECIVAAALLHRQSQ